MVKRYCVLAAAGFILACVAGCGEVGAMLYFLQPTSKTVKAEYVIPPGPVLVLVDDDQGLIHPPNARLVLVDAMARELKLHKISEKVTTNEEIARIRQAEPKFDQRGARELGQLAEARTVLLLSTQVFSVEDDLEMASVPGKFAVTVRVINANAETADEVRLWPSETTEHEGRLVEATVDPHVLRAGQPSQAAAHEKLADALASKVAELFYDRKVEQ